MSDEAVVIDAEPLETPAVEPAPAPAPEVTPEAEPESLDAALADRFDELEAEDDDDSLEIPRDEHGRFASKNPEAEAEGDEAQQASEDDGEPTEGEARPAIDAPHSWAPEIAEKWSELPSEVQEYVAQREQQAHQQISQMGQALSKYEPLEAVFQHHAPLFAEYNMDAATWVNNLSQVQETLDADPVRGVAWLADYYASKAGFESGEDFIQALAFGEAQPDPARQAEQQRVYELQRQNMQLQQQQEQFQQQQAQAKYQQSRTGIEQFAANIPDFDDHIPAIRTVLPGLQQQYPQANEMQILQEAYRWAKSRADADKSEQLAKDVASKKAQAEKAKRVSSGNVRGVDSQPTDGRSMDEMLSQVYDQHVAH